MGVSGSGKSTVGSALAERTGWRFLDADALHSPANVAKMAAGTPLTDDDRGPWLDAVTAWIAGRRAVGESAIVGCSAALWLQRDGHQVTVVDKKGPGEGHARGPAGVREESRLADAHEAARQDVLNEAAEKLHGGERHRAALITTGVVRVGEGHVLAVEGEESVIADRHAMGVAPEVTQDGGCAPEGGLRVDHPVGVEERVDEGAPRSRRAQVLAAAGEVKFVAVVGAAKRLDILAAKDLTEDRHGQEEARVRGVNPALAIGRQPTSRDHAVHVGMADQGLPPRVEEAQHANLGAEVARGRRDLAERRGARLKEPRVQTRPIPIGQRHERMREREDDVHIRHVEQVLLARMEPALPCLRLALRAVPVPT